MGRYSREFVSIDYYFCEKCLEEKSVRKSHRCEDHELSDIPDWAKIINNKIAGYD